MKTKIISLMLALATMLSLCPMTYAATDVVNTKYESAVESLEELGIINGYEDGTYKPEKEITRAEITKIVVVMLKLDTVADLYKGKTKFIDVAENHWATGFINVAAEYNIINGYEDNSFKPNAPVRYSEAVTMITRALGYKTMIEGKGTWPINYISKAQDLGILKGISYGNYNDNAIRGDIALLTWNALNIPTWGVISETEGDGLTFGKCPTLLEKNFKDYIYAEDLVEDISVKDGKVTLTLKENGDVELAKDIDFLNLKGRNITYTYNSKEEKIIQLTVSDKDKVVEGYLSDLEKDYDFTKADSQVWGAAKSGDTDYVVAVLGKEKAAAYMTRYSIKSHIVNNVKISKDKLKVNGSALSIDKNAIILIDNEWKTIEDVKVGDIITCLKTNELYVVSRKTVKGTFEAITETKDTKYITVNKVKYSVLNGTKEVVELDSDGDKVAAAALTDILNNKDSKFYGEKATLYINFLNEVAKITFDEIQEEDTGKFYIATYVHGYWTNIEQNGRKIYAYTELNGKEYEIKKGFDYPTIQGGDLVYAELDNKDRIINLQNITWDNVPAIENYEIHYLSGEGLMDDNYYINEYKVSNSTIIVKVNAIEIENDIDRYELEYLDREDIKNVKKCIVITDTNDNFNKAKYIFIWEDIESTNKNYGVVEMYEKTNGKEYLTINNHRYELDSLEIDYTTAALEDQAIEYIINDGTIKVTGIITYSDIENAPKVTAAEDDNYILDNEPTDVKELDKDEIYLIAEIDEDEEKITSIKKVDYKDVNLTKGDKVLITPAYTLIIK